jgi:hypothetical protein
VAGSRLEAEHRNCVKRFSNRGVDVEKYRRFGVIGCRSIVAWLKRKGTAEAAESCPLKLFE